MWAQDTVNATFNSLPANGIPIPTGGFVDNIVVQAPAEGPTVFSEDWETAPLQNQLPAGWTNAWPTNNALAGAWYVTAHGTIAQQSNTGSETAGTAFVPSGGADCVILLAPPPPTNNYVLNIGFHPFDNDGIGFVYDFQDTDNYSLVLFRQEATYAATVPPGLSVSRKSGGIWTDIVAADQSFLYTAGRAIRNRVRQQQWQLPIAGSGRGRPVKGCTVGLDGRPGRSRKPVWPGRLGGNRRPLHVCPGLCFANRGTLCAFRDHEYLTCRWQCHSRHFEAHRMELPCAGCAECRGSVLNERRESIRRPVHRSCTCGYALLPLAARSLKA